MSPSEREAQDVYDGLQRVGRIQPSGNRFVAFRLDRDDALRSIGFFASAKEARAAVTREGRHAA